jgi:hypothetical protein
MHLAYSDVCSQALDSPCSLQAALAWLPGPATMPGEPAAIRDALLPKLISGVLRVPDAERIVGRCLISGEG